MATQQPKELYDAMPCENCGGTHLVQTVTQREDVIVDSDGNPEQYNARSGEYDIIELWCTECDTKLWESDSEP